MYIDLPPDLEGCIYLHDPSDTKRIRYSFYALDGWYFRGSTGYYVKYSTKHSVDDTMIDIDISSEYAYLYLYD